MGSSSPNKQPPELPLGLRERKKLKTRAAIQDHALRLFRDQGYSQTTIEQIAEAAEVSPSTFFRYFPTKEDVVMFDATDPLMFDAFEAQPAELSVIEAMRRSFRAVYESFSPEQLERERERQRLASTEPELRARAITFFADTIETMVVVVARRTGRPADDIAVRAFAGGLVGAIMGTYLAFDFEDLELPKMLDLIDATLTQIEAGLPI